MDTNHKQRILSPQFMKLSNKVNPKKIIYRSTLKVEINKITWQNGNIAVGREGRAEMVIPILTDLTYVWAAEGIHVFLLLKINPYAPIDTLVCSISMMEPYAGTPWTSSGPSNLTSRIFPTQGDIPFHFACFMMWILTLVHACVSFVLKLLTNSDA